MTGAPDRRQLAGRVVVRSEYGLPYSKGLMAQSIMAAGLSPERSFALATQVEQRLFERAETEIGVDSLRELAEEVLRLEEGEQVLTRFRRWWKVPDLDRPLLVLIGGVTGVGKSTVATQLAGRLGITRVIATDQLRQVVRAFFSHDFMPAVHHSSFNVAKALSGLPDDAPGTVAGFLRQAHDLAPGIDALVQRAVSEGTALVLEGVHLLPEIPESSLRKQAIDVQVLLTVRDEQAHRAHFHMRGAQTPRSPERYLEAFDRIRILQEYLIERAEAAKIPIIDEEALEPALRRLMEVVLEAVGKAEEGAPVDRPGAGAKVQRPSTREAKQ
jgi:2-phosphoglycerate kinase